MHPDFAYPENSSENLGRFKTLIETRTGLMFNGHREHALLKGLHTAAQRTEVIDQEGYYEHLESQNTTSIVWDDLIGELTIGETYFFRNASHFDALEHDLIPRLLARHQRNRRLRIWSAGCSTGEEAYSLAILLHRMLPDIANWNIHILATDINRSALRRARLASYRQWSFREGAPEIQKRYFNQVEDTYELIQPIRDVVTFAYLNLAENSYPSLTTNTNAMDLILCRNVAIYLPESVNRVIAGRFYRSLSPEGWLIMGASETNIDVFRQFKSVNIKGATLYQKSATTGTVIRPVKLQHIESQPIPNLPAIVPPSQAIELASPPTPPAINTETDCFQNGLSMMKHKRYEEAQNYFLACIKNSPANAVAYYQIARLQANTGYLTNALTWLKQALQRDSLMVEAQYTMAMIYQERGEVDQAISQFKKTLYLNPNFVLAHFGLAGLYQRMGRTQLAERHRSQASRLAMQLPQDDELPASDGMTAGQLLKMMQATHY